MSLATKTSDEEDRDAIIEIVRNQAEAWNRGDAESFAERYSEDGSFTNIAGLQVHGKAGFVEQHAHIFRTIFAGSSLTLIVVRVRFVRPDVAVVDIDATLADVRQTHPSVGVGDDGVLRSKLQEVLTKEGGRWWIAAFHNVAVTRM